MNVEKVSENLSIIKSQLKKKIVGKIMIRKDSSYKIYDNKNNIARYLIYFDTPTKENKEFINELITNYGFSISEFRVIGGNYGYNYSFHIKYDN